MEKLEIGLNSLEETAQIAYQLGVVARQGDIIILSGDLGAGKTTLTKGIALGLGIHQTIKSPTYTIIREYQKGRIPLYHMDIYRVGESAIDLGIDEYFEGKGLCVVEWGDLLGEELPADYLEIILQKDLMDESKRKLMVKAYGTKAEDFFLRFRKGVDR